MKKNFMSIAASVAIVSAAVLFTGCGDSDSSSSSSGVSGALSGQLDPMAGVAYNTSSGVTGTTNGTGHFTFNPNDKVTFTIGALQITTANNLTQPDYVVNPDADGEVVASNSTLLTNLQELRKVIAGSTGAHNFVFTPAVMSALSTNLANKTAAITTAAAQLTTAQLIALAKTLGVEDPTSASASEVGGVDLTTKAQNAVQAAFAKNGASFNSAGATNKVVWIGGSAKAIDSAVNQTSITAGGTDYTMGGALTAGTPVLLTNGSQATIQAVMYNLTKIAGISAGSFAANKTIKIGVDGAPTQNETITFYTNGTFSANNTVQGIQTGTYSVRADGLGINMNSTASGFENRTITFEDDPTSTGVIANYWEQIVTTLKSIQDVIVKVVTALS